MNPVAYANAFLDPVAWWERRYVAQGVGVKRYGIDTYSGHSECLHYRVIAVDETGNESVAAAASPLPTGCPETPLPPTNLRASNGTGAGCSTRLDWDVSPGATEYYVYRTIIASGFPFFYDTQRVVAPLTSFTESGDGDALGNPDTLCGFSGVASSGGCATGRLEAYYVTARNETTGGGESPRSNLVFWKCQEGYLARLNDSIQTDAIASLARQSSNETLACWITDAPGPERVRGADDERGEMARPGVLATAPMLRLGQSNDPPWTVLNLHTDHLGTVRMITDTLGVKVSRHDYFPFGEEIDPPLSYNTHQYTGHERDHLPGMDPATGMDYMLARYYDAGVGRFLSVDPASSSVHAKNTQTWNRYSYVLNNPLMFVDPTGQEWQVNASPKGKTKLTQAVGQNLFGKGLVINKKGQARLESNGQQGPATRQQATFENVVSQLIDKGKTTTNVVEQAADTPIANLSLKTIDVDDVHKFGSSNPASEGAVLIHELAEQYASQNIPGASDSASHDAGIKFEDGFSGWSRGVASPLSPRPEGVTGNYNIPYSQGSASVIVTIQFSGGNVVDVTRH